MCTFGLLEESPRSSEKSRHGAGLMPQLPCSEAASLLRRVGRPGQGCFALVDASYELNSLKDKLRSPYLGLSARLGSFYVEGNLVALSL